MTLLGMHSLMASGWCSHSMVPRTGSPCPFKNTPMVLEPVKLVTRNSCSPGITTTLAFGTKSSSDASICVTGRTSVMAPSARSIRL